MPPCLPVVSHLISSPSVEQQKRALLTHFREKPCECKPQYLSVIMPTILNVVSWLSRPYTWKYKHNKCVRRHTVIIGNVVGFVFFLFFLTSEVPLFYLIDPIQKSSSLFFFLKRFFFFFFFILHSLEVITSRLLARWLKCVCP